MRILHVVDGHLPEPDTWAALRARNVACAQLELGFEPTVLALDSPRTSTMAGADAPLDLRIERMGFVPEAGPESASWRDRGMFFHRTTRRVRRLVSREKLHLVHVYGRPTIALASLIGGHQAEVPVVYEPSALEFGPNHLPPWVLAGFDAIVTPSRARMEDWTARMGRRVRVHYMPDGIDEARLRDVAPLPDAPTFLVTPIFDARPDLVWLQDALSRQPALRRRLRLGVAAAEDRDRLRVDWGLGVDQVFRFAPTLDALGDALTGATALLHLADAPFGTPFEVLEAAAQGRTVVARTSPGQSELIRDGQSGRLVAAKDERGLANALAEVAERAESMGRALRRDAARSRSWNVIAEGYFEIYDRTRRPTSLGGTLQKWAERTLHRVEPRWLRERARRRS